MVLRVSNQKFFDVLDPVPLENIGWEIKVFMRNNPNTLVTLVPRWTHLSATAPMSDVGAGEVHILRDDRIFKDVLPIGVVSEILEDETIWKFYWDGIHRFSMFCEDVDKDHIDDKERAVVRVTGRTTGKALEHATVLPNSYPAHTQNERNFIDRSVMNAWIELYIEAENRGAIPVYFANSASLLADTSGEPWIDLSTFTIPPGGNLLDLLKRYSEIASVDWQVTKNNVLDIRREWGAHREETIVFHVAGSILKHSEQKTRRDVKNHLYVEGGGVVMEAVDNDSKTKWGRREAWITAGESADATTTSAFGASALQTLKNERNQITAKVLPSSPGRVIFVDYDLGDWVTIESDELDNSGNPRREAVKIVAVSWSVDENGKMDLELTLSTRIQESIIRMQQAIARLTGGGGLATGGTGASSPVSTGAVIGASNFDDLADVNFTGLAEGNIVKRSGTNWVNSPMPALDDLTGVNLAGITDGQLVGWDQAAGEFRPKTISGGGGFNPSPVDDPSNWTANQGEDQEFGAVSSSPPAGWSIINQGSSVYTEQFGAGRLDDPAHSGYQWRMITRAINASASWVATFKLSMTGRNAADFYGAILLRESATGEITALEAYHGSFDSFYVDRWNSPTTWNSTQGSNIQNVGRHAPFVYMRIRKNSGTSWDFEVSPDGICWSSILTGHNVSAFMIPDQIGFGLNTSNNVASAIACHWYRVRA